MGVAVDRKLIKNSWFFHRFRGTPAALDKLSELIDYPAMHYIVLDANDVEWGPGIWTQIDVYLLHSGLSVSSAHTEYLQRAIRRLLPRRLTLRKFRDARLLGARAHFTPGLLSWSVGVKPGSGVW